MQTLYLVRHAKAIPSDVGVADFKRALSKPGEREARRMSKRLRKHGIRPKLFLSSPADRALETAHIFAAKLKYPVQDIVLHDAIYENTAAKLHEIVNGLADGPQTVMLFGHNPSVSELAKYFLPERETEIRTGGVVGIAFEAETWRDIAADNATLVLDDFPVQISPETYKQARQILRRDISTTLEGLVVGLDARASRSVEKLLKKTSKRLAKKLLKVLPVSKVEELAGGNPYGE